MLNPTSSENNPDNQFHELITAFQDAYTAWKETLQRNHDKFNTGERNAPSQDEMKHFALLIQRAMKDDFPEFTKEVMRVSSENPAMAQKNLGHMMGFFSRAYRGNPVSAGIQFRDIAVKELDPEIYKHAIAPTRGVGFGS